MKHKKVKLELQCPECGEEFDFTLWLIGDEEKKSEILSGELFRTVCTNCENKATFCTDFVYFDDTHNAVVRLTTKNELLFDKKMVEEEDKKAAETENEDPGEPCTLIGVSSHEDLRTAIMCLDNDLDYRVVKLLLYTLKNEYLANSKDTRTIKCLGVGDHHNKEGELLYSVYLENDDEIVYAPLPMDRYNEYLTLYKDKLDKAEMFVFDDEGCEFFLNHLEDIDSDNKKDITVYLMFADNGPYLTTCEETNIKPRDQFVFKDGEDEIHAYYVSKYKTNTIALGREVTSLPIAELYVEGGAC